MRNEKGIPIRALLGLAAAIAVAALSARRRESESVAPPPPPPASVDGARLIQRHGCFRCHVWRGVAVLDEGPALDRAGRKLRPEWTLAFLADPSGSRMPAIALTEAERGDLVAFLTSLGREPPLPRGRRGDAARGAALFEDADCASCHQPGRPEPDLGPVPRKIRRDWLIAFLRAPRAAQPDSKMPDFDFSQEEAEDLAEHLLAGAAEPGGEGPAAEAEPSRRGRDAFVGIGCIACHRVGPLRGADMESLLARRADLALHRRGSDRAPRIDLSAPEEEAIRRTLEAWLARPAAGSDSLAGSAFDGYWTLPVPPQGEPPKGWSGLERALDPAACGVCHPRQLHDWKGSLHARAVSPGFRAELLYTEDSSCLDCHAPLSEQRRDLALRAAAVSCAACHVRAHRRHGPPIAALDPLEPARRGAHGGAARGPFLEDARFCARCHQFREGESPMPGDEPIMNTLAEWEESPAARAGKACQSCHMPGRRHLWRGIHDPEMVRSALRLEIDGRTILLRSAAGHRTPTYVVPRITVGAWLEDGRGREVPGSRRAWTIARTIRLTGAHDDGEISDTRLEPGKTRAYDYDVEDDRGSVLAVSVDVEPDAYYRDLYESRLAYTQPDPERRALYEEALAKPLAPPYNVFTRRVPVPRPPERR